MSLPTTTSVRALKVKATGQHEDLQGPVRLGYGKLMVDAIGWHSHTTRTITTEVDLAKLLDELAAAPDTRLMMLAALTNHCARAEQ